MRRRALLGVASALAVGLTAVALARGGEDDRRPMAPQPVVASPAPRALAPVAIRYRGILCGEKGCLFTTISNLCRSQGVRRLLVQVRAVPGSLEAKAILIAIPGASGWNRGRILALARSPFAPVRVRSWHEPLPAWDDWCPRVAV